MLDIEKCKLRKGKFHQKIAIGSQKWCVLEIGNRYKTCSPLKGSTVIILQFKTLQREGKCIFKLIRSVQLIGMRNLIYTLHHETANE